MKKLITAFTLVLFVYESFPQNIAKTMLRLPDTGETTSYTSTFGEDNDYLFNAPYFTDNGNGTVTDTITKLMWQQTDGGEMTIENAALYCENLTLGGFNDWRLTDAHESFSILNHQNSNPALNTSVFTTSAAEYWWTSEHQANDANKIWVTNAGGGIGNHPKTETISAGGSKRFHVRAVRELVTPTYVSAQFTDNADGTITDNLTNLIWQKTPYSDSITWEDALNYAETLSLNGFSDWRLPNIKELQSINDESLINPSLNINYFSTGNAKKYWSSTTLPNHTTEAWYLDTHFGITTYAQKTAKNYVICVRGDFNISTTVTENKMQNIIAYPNPFLTNIYIANKTGNQKYELFNSLSQLIYSGPNIEDHDFSYLSYGIYYLKITDNKSTSVFKVFKE